MDLLLIFQDKYMSKLVLSIRDFCGGLQALIHITPEGTLHL